MEVVLLDHIDELGFLGQEVKVRAGYARNYLVPRKLAVYASDSTRLAFKATLSVRSARQDCHFEILTSLVRRSVSSRRRRRV